MAFKRRSSDGLEKKMAKRYNNSMNLRMEVEKPWFSWFVPIGTLILDVQ